MHVCNRHTSIDKRLGRGWGQEGRWMQMDRTIWNQFLTGTGSPFLIIIHSCWSSETAVQWKNVVTCLWAVNFMSCHLDVPQQWRVYPRSDKTCGHNNHRHGIQSLQLPWGHITRSSQDLPVNICMAAETQMGFKCIIIRFLDLPMETYIYLIF